MKRLCYISRNYRNLNGAGNKAKTDNEDTLREMGAVNLGLARSFHKSKIATFLLDLAGIVRYLFAVRPGDVILLQYPVKKYFSFVCRVAGLRGARTIALIHDLGSFRRKKLTVAAEIRRLMHADYVIASNRVMQTWLADNGYTRPTGALGLFDYRSPALRGQTATVSGHPGQSPTSLLQSGTPAPPTYRQGHARLVYAGALAMRKNAFILRLPDLTTSYRLHIYGDRAGLPSLRDCEGIVFHGFMPADDFISSVDADFGLVWDGDSLDSCTGNFGGYLRYNSPHKVSFYIRAGLPIIIWNKAAIADIIVKEGIGICIDSLNRLDETLKDITTEDYKAMHDRVMDMSKKLDCGQFLRNAIDTALSSLKDK